MISLQDKSYINVLTPTYFIFIPTTYILELIGLQYFGFGSSESAYLFIYLTYTIYFISLTLGYLFLSPPAVLLPNKHKLINIGLLPYLFLACGILIYLPVIIEFKDSLTNPREIYRLTRTGYGISFFLSTTFIYLFFILSLFKGKTLIPLLITIFFTLLHGSKSQVMTPFLILILYRVYILGKKVRLSKAFGYGALLTAIIFSLFFIITFEGLELDSALEIISSYSDVTRNTALVVDNFRDYTFGRLTLEDHIFPRIPRAIFPDKPKDFGMFFLAKEYFPEWFEADTGSPYFGILGVPFADFGYFSIFYLSLVGFFMGFSLKLFKARLNFSKSPSDFIMLLFFSGLSLIPTGAGFLLPDHLILAGMIALLLRFRFFSSSSEPMKNNPTIINQWSIEKH